jgi:hypothetical protein
MIARRAICLQSMTQAITQALRLALIATALVWASLAFVGCGNDYYASSGSGPSSDGGGVVDEAGSDGGDGAVNVSPNVPALAALSISAAALAPAFSPDVLEYTAGPVAAANLVSKTTTTVTAVASDPNAHVAVNGVAVVSGVASPPIPLQPGTNSIDVAVVSADGSRTTLYHVAVAGVVDHYLKASNTMAQNAASRYLAFGRAIALSDDGNTLAVGADFESSGAPFVNGNEQDITAFGAGAVYVFVRSSGAWSQQAYVKASDASTQSHFGISVSLSADGNLLAVGASRAAKGGAVYVFARSGSTWAQAALLNASNTGGGFGDAVALSRDGKYLAVGAPSETSAATGINGNQADTSISGAGAVYVFTSGGGGAWAQQAYVKASNTRQGAVFGSSVAISSDGSTLAVGSSNESSAATGIDGNQADTTATGAGAAYVFVRSGPGWTQQAYVKASNANAGNQNVFFGTVALSGDGNTLAVGAPGECSGSTGINGSESGFAAGNSGAIYVFTRAASMWSQQSYVKASNTRAGATLGSSVALSADGSTLAAGSPGEDSAATGVGGVQSSGALSNAGAAYLFAYGAGGWSQEAYVKASNTRAQSSFGASIAIAGTAPSLVVGAPAEDSAADGIDGNQADTSAAGGGTSVSAGAVYAY